MGATWNLVGDFEVKNGKSIGRAESGRGHKRMLNLDTHKQPVNPGCECLESGWEVRMKLVMGILRSLRAVTSTRYASKVFN